jgi:hypothetical protein
VNAAIAATAINAAINAYSIAVTPASFLVRFLKSVRTSNSPSHAWRRTESVGQKIDERLRLTYLEVWRLSLKIAQFKSALHIGCRPVQPLGDLEQFQSKLVVYRSPSRVPHLVQRVIPGNSLSTRIGMAFRTGAPHRVKQVVTASTEARPMARSALPVGCGGSGSIATSRP